MPPDDRIRCPTCASLRADGMCQAAEQGQLSHTAGRYRPDLDVPHRCVGYRPLRGDSDQRTGRERWGWLVMLVEAARA